MKNTHQLVIESDHVAALGNGNYFSWMLIPEFGEWVVVTIYGGYHATCKTFKEALESIGFERRK